MTFAKTLSRDEMKNVLAGNSDPQFDDGSGDHAKSMFKQTVATVIGLNV